MALSISPKGFEEITVLPLYTSRELATAENTEGTRFSLVVGLREDAVRQLKERSLDTTDTELACTSDRKRFGEGSYEEWYAKKRVPFALLEQGTGKLAAIIWFGPKALGLKSAKHVSAAEDAASASVAAEDWHTVSFRSYPPFRGKGLMKDFARFSMEAYVKGHPERKIWAGTTTSNEGSIAIATKLGFHVLEEASDREGGWLTFVQ